VVRIAKVVLYVQIAFLAFGTIVFLAQLDALSAAEPARSRQTAAFFIATALVLLLLVVRRFEGEPQWLLVPIIFSTVDGLVTHAVDAAAQIGVVHTAYDPLPLPLILDLIIVPIYVVAYRELTRMRVVPSNAAR
jgi:hypothetical protein